MAKQLRDTEQILNTYKKEGRYYWMKLQTNFFDSQDIKVIEKQNNGEKYIVFWLKMLLLAIKQEEVGILRYKAEIPYTPEILSTVTNTDIDVVHSALTLFDKFGMIRILENGDVLIEEVLRMVGSESESAHRVRKFREINKQKLFTEKTQNNQTLHCNVEESKKREEKKREDLEKSKDNTEALHYIKDIKQAVGITEEQE